MSPRLKHIPSASVQVAPAVLTPRTPHSRAGRAEEALTKFESEQMGDEDDHDSEHPHQQQTVPLLTSSTSESFPPLGYRARGDDYDEREKRTAGRGVLQWLIANSGLIFGSALAFVLFLSIVLSYQRPDILLSAINVNEPSPSSTPTPIQDDVLPPPTNPENIISYENYTFFPLDPLEYRAECYKIVGDIMAPMGYWSGDKDVVHPDEFKTGKHPAEGGICSKTITYMLDGHVGLLADLALMAQVAGLARMANRTFLIDDTYWNRGKWTDHFQDVRVRQPGPEPGCRAPPAEELVACPKNARHWIVNSQTAKYHLGHDFSEEFEDPYGHELNRFRDIYYRAQVSLTETIHPNEATSALISSARSELASFLGLDSNDITDQYQGIHVRRGDGKGSSWKYHGTTVPIEEYVTAGKAAWTRLFRAATPLSVYLASDDPNVFETLRSQFGADSRIFSLAESENPDLQKIASPAPYFQSEFSALPEAVRMDLTKGMIVDFALLSGLWAGDDDLKPGAVICGIQSNVCKMAAVSLDWDRAFGYGFRDDSMGEVNQEHARWIEVDEKGSLSPPWRAFQLF